MFKLVDEDDIIAPIVLLAVFLISGIVTIIARLM